MIIETPWLKKNDHYVYAVSKASDLFMCVTGAKRWIAGMPKTPKNGDSIRFKIEISTEGMPCARRIKLRWNDFCGLVSVGRSDTQQPLTPVRAWLYDKLQNVRPNHIWVRAKK